MPTDLPHTPFEWGLLGLSMTVLVWVVYALLRGNLVSRRVMDERVKDWEARLAQALENSEFWKETAEAYRTANVELIPVINELKENHQTLLRLMLGLKEIGESGAHGN